MLCSILLSLLCSPHPFCSARDTITKGDPIIDDESVGLVSAGGRFELGFFSPKGTRSGRRYVGIWYHKLIPRTVVWVANRDKPLLANSTGVVEIKHGTLQVLDNTSGKSLWSAEIEATTTAYNRTVKLKENGNLVLIDTDQHLTPVLWQSFENPTDTFIPGMKLDKSLNLTSWNDKDDPGTGNFNFNRDEYNHYIIKKLSADYWRSGEPNGNSFSSDEMPLAVAYLLSNFSESYSKKRSSNIFKHKSSTFYTETAVPPQSEYINTRLVIDFTGKLNWYNYTHDWNLTWWEPRNNCSVVNPCGDFGICNSTNKPMCQCLHGFKAQYQQKWDSGDFTGGCQRESKLCTGTNDTFFSLSIKNVQNPDSQFNDSETFCRNKCLRECECQAYSYTEIRKRTTTYLCYIWKSVPSNLEEDYGGQTLYARIAGSDLGTVRCTSLSLIF